MEDLTTVVVSGYFDPLHVGHIEYLDLAKSLGDILVVIVNNDKQAALKKGKSFMPDKIIFLKDLPKTRNMKIMRRVIKSCLINEDPGDLSALLNPESVEEIKKHAI